MSKQVNYAPLASDKTPRYADIATFMRLPNISIDDASDIDIGLIGVPWDSGTTNRPGARHGPRQVREMSALMRRYHPVLDISPYELANCVDLGDSPVNPVNLTDALAAIESYYDVVIGKKIIPLSCGGDHLTTLPILRALAKSHGPLGLIQFDAHTDTWDSYFGDNKFTHGTPFRRAIEEAIVDPKRYVQIGIRGGLYDKDDCSWQQRQGVTMFSIDDCFNIGLDAVLAQAKELVGDKPTYVTFDIDCLDPVFAPGTGTPEIGGFSSYDVQKMIRLLRGTPIIGADMVEVSPPFDSSGGTALIGATVLFEFLCIVSELIKNQ